MMGGGGKWGGKGGAPGGGGGAVTWEGMESMMGMMWQCMLSKGMATKGGELSHAGCAGGKGPTPPGGKPGDWTCPNCGDLVFASKMACKMCGTPRHGGGAMVPMGGGKGPTPPGGKPGDWSCPNCGDLVFASKTACKMCGTPRHGGGPGMDMMGMMSQMMGQMGAKGKMGGKGPTPKGGKPGDWICHNCGDLVFASKSACKMCGTPKDPMAMGAGCGAAGQTKPGDWFCPGCNNLNFSYRTACNQCGMENAGVQRIGVKPGDWFCPNCGDLCFASKSQCKMCGTDKLAEEDAGGGAYAPEGKGASSRASPY